MNVITAKRRGACVVCSMPIEVGEQIDYERHRGARHLACADREAQARRNLYAMRCELCGVQLARNAGELRCIEREVEGAWHQRWTARCVDAQGCDARIRAGT